jgi:hypothetical protein
MDSYGMDDHIAASSLPARFGLSRRSSSKSMNIDGCSVICMSIIIVTLALLYHVHNICVKEEKAGNKDTAQRMCNVRTGIVILLILEGASLYMHMRK